MSEHQKIGFTGTQRGMSIKQLFEVSALLELFNYAEHDDPIDEVHHGMCIGADREFHDIVRHLDQQIKIIGHPTSEAYVSKELLAIELECDEVRVAQHPLTRNRDIVNECTLLIAAPATVEELQRSGTWATVRYARKINREVRIFEP